MICMCRMAETAAPTGAFKPSALSKQGVETAAATHRIRITLTARNVRNLEKGECSSNATAVKSLNCLQFILSEGSGLRESLSNLDSRKSGHKELSWAMRWEVLAP